jgi:CelD/BcsL family acetyltransferase involved in cellulose biosynthesis
VLDAKLLEADVALERHGDRWRELAIERSNGFVTPEWFDAWRRHYGDAGTVRVAVASASEGEVTGLLPLVGEREGGLRLTRVAGANMADLIHPVCAVADEVEVALATQRALQAEPKLPRALLFDNVDGAATWWSVIGEAAGLRVAERGRTIGPYASLEGDYQAYLGRRSSSFRKRQRRIDNRIAREASIEMRRLDGDEVAGGIATLFELHDRRWEGRGVSSLASPTAREFHVDFARAASERGWLRLWLFEDAGKPVAAFYGWRVGNRYAYYQSGLDPEYGRLSIGQYMHAKVIESAIAEGATEYDMLLGDEGYKSSFTDDVRDLRSVVLCRPLSRERFVVGAEIGARKMVRRLPPDLRSKVRARLVALNARLPTGRRR